MPHASITEPPARHAPQGTFSSKVHVYYAMSRTAVTARQPTSVKYVKVDSTCSLICVSGAIYPGVISAHPIIFARAAEILQARFTTQRQKEIYVFNAQ